MNTQLFCNKDQHQDQIIIGLCLHPQCSEQRTCCSMCILQDHNTHETSVQKLEDLKITYSSKINEIKLLNEMKKKVLELFDHIEKALITITPIFPADINFDNLNKFGILITSQATNDSKFEFLKQKFEDSTLIISGTLVRIVNLIQTEDRISYYLRKGQSEKLRKIGVKLHNQGQDEQAIAVFNRSLQIDSQNEESWNSKGISLAVLNKFDESMECFDQALQIAPDSFQFIRNKALSLFQLQKYQEALIEIDKSIDLNPNYVPSWNTKGKFQLKKVGAILRKINRNEEAVECFKKCVSIEPDEVEFCNLASTLEELGQLKEAMQYYRESLKIKKDLKQSVVGIKRLRKYQKREQQYE